MEEGSSSCGMKPKEQSMSLVFLTVHFPDWPDDRNL